MNRVVRAKAARALRASKAAELGYVRDLRGIVAHVHTGYMLALVPHMGGLRHDARGPHTDTLDLLNGKLVRYVREQTGSAFDRMADRVDKKSRAASSALLGLRPTAHRLIGVAPVLADVQRFREQNIQLVENAAQTYADQVRAVFEDPGNFGMRAEALSAKLQERADVSDSRADLIARDQTLKLSGQLNKVRQVAAGVAQYDWSTSGDELVRPDHAALDGARLDWNTPPITNQRTGARNLPGQDFQCRCVAIPVIAELDGA